jgi:HPt (histidine-containing phosphotransfer) domain-containing protein
MEKALSANNVESYLEFAHALKGSAGSIGALQIHNLCRSALESNTKESTYLEILQKTHQAFRETEKLLLEYVPVKIAQITNRK